MKKKILVMAIFVLMVATLLPMQAMADGSPELTQKVGHYLSHLKVPHRLRAINSVDTDVLSDVNMWTRLVPNRKVESKYDDFSIGFGDGWYDQQYFSIHKMPWYDLTDASYSGRFDFVGRGIIKATIQHSAKDGPLDSGSITLYLKLQWSLHDKNTLVITILRVENASPRFNKAFRSTVGKSFAYASTAYAYSLFE